MKDFAGQAGSFVEAVDRIALAHGIGITAGGEHHAECCARIPVHVDLVQSTLECGFAKHGEVRAQSAHDGLGFRVAKTTVELEHVRRAIRRDHDASVEKTRVRHAICGESADGRVDHLTHDALVHGGRDHRRGRVSAHAPGVGTGVAVANAFVILRSGERQHVLAVGHDDEASFLARQEFFDHHFGTGATELTVEHGTGGLDRLIGGIDDQHALAGGQSACLDDDGRTLTAYPVGIKIFTGEGGMGGGRDAVSTKEFFGECLGAFELGGCLARAKAAQPGSFEGVDHTEYERCLGTDDGQIDLFVAGEGDEPFDVFGIDGHIAHAGFAGGAGVTRGHQHFADTRRLGTLPGERVFAPAATHDEDLDHR